MATEIPIETSLLGREVMLNLMISAQYPVQDDPVARFSEQLEQTRFARDHGFDGVIATQHYLAYPFQYLHPLAILARLVPETGDMRIATGISLSALAHPVDLAEQLATVDIMSNGRLSVGVGLGYRDLEFAAFGLGKKGRLKRYLDNIDLMRQLWTSDRVTADLDHARLDDVPIALRPVQRPHPPLSMAAHSKTAIERTAKMGIPWAAAAAHVDGDYFRQQVDIFRRACTTYGNEGLPMIVGHELYVASTEEAALDVVRRSLAVKYAAYQQWGQDTVLPESQSFDKEFEELRKGRFIIGDPATCARQLQTLIDDVQPAQLTLRMNWPGMTRDELMSGLELFVNEVMPQVPALRPTA
ncbi:alkanesulfonate monooxygenase SsuD/methylene tetrahydromethanopterin reductase-like flavin-dependent oxidoreductase (luciferase family) [Antricoccus suffuscus]|uniref:Alkanesulfonate monooxygenase SsuD/methylene tetrahydromethanopterin reductase-like flavin-dependent oxidoreductase (Luciferase family) n=1 Tax=Antricoccus suffuscus TaxID=1629062 RepID=A0A2T1A117_9ACTN|nr:LLM class flavin-dependent oxidoreductase [Antricoccus suffuscus]PRZ42299.1 alkanesulfonate monooxygenase SsuD/methylene tetrahydromethanopterin reductase-like flavin-dependent oxidoreductase (luciferase family) [Antricoccus suffuscus]